MVIMIWFAVTVITSTIESPENILVEIASVLPLLHQAVIRFH